MMKCDSLGRVIRGSKPQSIISLVPSWSEFLVDIGVMNKVIGRTDYCVYPEKIQEVENIGGTKNPNIPRILNLQPDLVIANKEENKQSDINLLRANQIEVLVTSAITIEDALYEVKIIEEVINGTSEVFHEIRNKLAQQNVETKMSFLYLVWNNPLMAAGKTTFISNSLEYFGWINIITNNDGRYPKLKNEIIKDLDPDIVFLPDEPYKFTEQHKEQLKQIFPNSKLILIDGKTLSWYGRRIGDIPQFFGELKL